MMVSSGGWTASITSARPRVDRDAPRIKQLCAAHGLEIAGLTSYVRPDEDDAISRLIDACRALGCPRFRIFSARYDPAVGYFALRDRTRGQLDRLARRLEGSGVKALLEIHFGTIVASLRSSCCAISTRRPSE